MLSFHLYFFVIPKKYTNFYYQLLQITSYDKVQVNWLSIIVTKHCYLFEFSW